MTDPLADDLAMKQAAAQGDPLADDLVQKQKRAHLETKHAQYQTEIAALKADEQGAGGYVKAGLGELADRAKGIGRAGASLAGYGAHVASNPLTVAKSLVTDDYPEEDARRRELLRGVDDQVTLGYGKKLADKLAGAVGGQQLGATEQDDATAAPGMRAAGNLAGAFTPGAASSIARGAGRIAGGMVKSTGMLGSAARAALGYEVAAPAIAGLHAESAGNRTGNALDAAGDVPSVMLAAGVGGGVGGVSQKVNSSRGAQARQFIEERGGRVGPTTAGSGGPFDRELGGLEANDRGIGQAARVGAEAITKGLKEQHRVETSLPFKAMKAAIDNSPAAAQPRDITPIVQHMQNAVYDLETAPEVRAQLQGQLGILERYRQPNGPVALPESQLNGLRRSLSRMAKLGQTDAPGEKEAPLRAAAFEAKKMVDQGPYAALNQFYAEGAGKLAESRAQLGLKPRPNKDAGVEVRKVKLGLERHGQNTKTAGGDSDLSAFQAAHPSLARNVDLPELMRAKADLSFNFQPKHGGLIERTVGANAGPLAALGIAMGHPAAALPLATQNIAPIAGRFLYPLTRGSTGTAGARLVNAAEMQRRRRATAAQALTGGQ